MRISDWSSDVCSSDLDMQLEPKYADEASGSGTGPGITVDPAARQSLGIRVVAAEMGSLAATFDVNGSVDFNQRSEEHTSELQSLMRISYAVFCLKKKKENQQETHSKLQQRTLINIT